MEYETKRESPNKSKSPSSSKGRSQYQPSLFEQRNGYRRKLWLDLSLVERFDPITDTGTPKAPRPNNYATVLRDKPKSP